jgi:hypothetical protein
MVSDSRQVPEFGREFLGADQTFTRIGSGELGGKAAGLRLVREKVLSGLTDAGRSGFEVAVPTLTVLTTELFDSFMERNGLYEVAVSNEPDDRIAHAFQQGELPAEFVGDLRALIAGVHTPLAVRSSSLLEDALAHPFAGVFGTKMIPNNQADIDTRFHRLVEAIKFVYASTFFEQPKSYVRSIGQDLRSEKMAVIIQEIVGTRYDDRFYPAISGVARSYSYYPGVGSLPEEGVVNLALGLGKQIVDGGLSWTYSPARPEAPPPYAGVGDLMDNTQTEFWAVNMGPPPPHDPVRETEYLVRDDLESAAYDGSIDNLVSSYDMRSERLRPGMSGEGPYILDFSPILCYGAMPLNDLLVMLLALSESALGGDVELEFAVALDRRGKGRPRFGFLQARPMAVSRDEISLSESDLAGRRVIVASQSVMGNGSREDIADIVYVKPQTFDAGSTREIAEELSDINSGLTEEGRPYMVVGFGRWGSSDPWLGIPVDWGQISNARVIVEATLPDMTPDMSQGSHFFHNLISFGVLYLSVRHSEERGIDWKWMDGRPAVGETRFVRHVRLAKPLRVRVDGRARLGVVEHA